MTDKSPAFQFYPGDFLSDENVISMTFEERGIYITLLSNCWIQGSIPADPDKIIRLLPGYVNENGMPSQVMDCFKEMEGDSKRLVHPRLDKEREKQKDFKEAKSESGKRGAAERWKNHQTKPSNGSAIVSPLAKNSSLSLSSSSSSSLNLNTHAIYENFEEDWNLYPRKAGNKIKARVCYHKSVGKDPDKRKLFLEKMQAYVSNTDVKYLQHGETFFRNWEALVVDTVKSRRNGNEDPPPYIPPPEPVERVRGDPKLEKLWDDSLDKIKAQITPEDYEMWFGSTYPKNIEDGRLLVAVPNQFTRKAMIENYRNLIENTLQALHKEPVLVDFCIAPP